MTQELEARQSNLPGQAYSPGAGLTAEDVALPRLKVAEKGTGHVDDGTIEQGSLFTELSSDDPEPETLAKPSGRKVGDVTGPVRFFVLAGPRVSYSWNDEQDNFFVRPEGHPEVEAQIAKYGAKGKDKKIPRRGYNYVLALPDFDTELPYKFLLKGASSNTAKTLNLMLMKAAAAGPAEGVLFELSAKKSQKDEYTFYKFEVRRADVPDSELEKLQASVEGLVGFAQAIASDDRKVFNEASRESDVVDAPSIA